MNNPKHNLPPNAFRREVFLCARQRPNAQICLLQRHLKAAAACPATLARLRLHPFSKHAGKCSPPASRPRKQAPPAALAALRSFPAFYSQPACPKRSSAFRNSVRLSRRFPIPSSLLRAAHIKNSWDCIATCNEPLCNGYAPRSAIHIGRPKAKPAADDICGGRLEVEVACSRHSLLGGAQKEVRKTTHSGGGVEGPQPFPAGLL